MTLDEYLITHREATYLLQASLRQRMLLPGETTRKRLGIPMFMGEVK
jgi:hypothetical protein